MHGYIIYYYYLLYSINILCVCINIQPAYINIYSLVSSGSLGRIWDIDPIWFLSYQLFISLIAFNHFTWFSGPHGCDDNYLFWILFVLFNLFLREKLTIYLSSFTCDINFFIDWKALYTRPIILILLFTNVKIHRHFILN